MKGLPILFSGAMVRGLLREIEAPGTGKAMTRRMPWAWLRFMARPGHWVKFSEDLWRAAMVDRSDITALKLYGDDDPNITFTWTSAPMPHQEGAIRTTWYAQPVAKPGDRLWVRERTKCIAVRGEEIKVRYDADGYEPGVWLPFPSRLRFTPRAGELLSMGCYLEASRITLDVSATKIERLQDISEADAMAEGVQLKVDQDGNRLVDIGSKHSPLHYIDPKLRGKGGKAIDAAWTFRCHFAALWDSLHGPGAWDANPEVVAITFTPHRINILNMDKK